MCSVAGEGLISSLVFEVVQCCIGATSPSHHLLPPIEGNKSIGNLSTIRPRQLRLFTDQLQPPHPLSEVISLIHIDIPRSPITNLQIALHISNSPVPLFPSLPLGPGVKRGRCSKDARIPEGRGGQITRYAAGSCCCSSPGDGRACCRGGGQTLRTATGVASSRLGEAGEEGLHSCNRWVGLA